MYRYIYIYKNRNKRKEATRFGEYLLSRWCYALSLFFFFFPFPLPCLSALEIGKPPERAKEKKKDEARTFFIDVAGRRHSRFLFSSSSSLLIGEEKRCRRMFHNWFSAFILYFTPLFFLMNSKP